MKIKSTGLLFIIVLLSQSIEAQNFQPYIEIPTTNEIIGVKIADVNNDGLNDVLTSYANSGSIKIQFQNTNHTLNSFVTLPVDESKVTSFDIGDLNQDGLNDIVLTFGNSYGIFYQNTSGSFNPLQKFDTGKQTGVVRIGDMNKDNVNDIVFLDFNSINLLYQAAPGVFVAERISQTHYFGEMRIADINNDQRNDLIFSSSPTREIFTFRQKEAGGFLPPVKTYTNTSMSGLAVGDLNDDGLTDMVTTIYEGGASALKVYYPSLNDYIFYSYIQYPAVRTADTVQIADLNNDGKNEVIVGNNGLNSFSIYSSSYNNFKLIKTIDIPYYYANAYQSLAVGDINNDGANDLVFTKPGGVIIVYNTGNYLQAANVDASTEIIIFPNPVTDQIAFNRTLKNFDYEIYDFSGKQIRNGMVDSSNHIDVSTLPSGNYMIVFPTSLFKLRAQTFIKK